jgi:poly(3-hydroxybutyrate) depolymerase
MRKNKNKCHFIATIWKIIFKFANLFNLKINIMKKVALLFTSFLAVYAAGFKRIVTLGFFCLTVVLIFAENPVKRVINADGFDREYLLYTPENNSDKAPEGIVVYLHGFNGSMQDFFNKYNFSEMADALNCIVLAPQALREQDQALLTNPIVISLFTEYGISLNSVWACGLAVKAYVPSGDTNIVYLDEELNKNVNDVDFIASIIDNTVSEFGLDGRNIFVLGTSMGGYMSYQFALKHGDKLSGLISVSGSMGTKIKAAENPVKVPICDFHSLTDDLVPYHGSMILYGLMVDLAKDKEEIINYWVNNNMAGSPIVENVQYYPSSNGITVEKFTYPAPDYEVIHYKMNGSDHTHFFTKEVDCMDYKEEVLKFIQSHVYVSVEPGEILYVKQNGTGSGSSWADASPKLADALLAAKTNKNIKEIWVAEGTYKPLYAANGTSTNSRDKAFVLVEGLKIYGGFPANANDTEHTSISTRGLNPSLNATILSGDLNGDDTGNLNTNRSDNAYHVVIGANIPADKTILDGFTITGGNANGSSSITVNGQTVNSNSGGGIYNDYSSPTLINLTVSRNTASYGGGIFNTTSSSPTLTNLTISGNRANYGGGICNDASSSPSLTNITISGNTAITDGGGMSNYSYSSPILTNITISGNTATGGGGGIYNYSSTSPKLINSIVWGNSASSGNNVYNYYNTPTYNYSLVQGEDLTGTGTGNFNGLLWENNPLFVLPATAPDPTPTGNYRLQTFSPAINAGDNDSYKTARGLTPSLDVDLDGNPRLYDDRIDLGAYEYRPVLDPSSIVYIKQDGPGNGSSWRSAYPELADALLLAKSNANIKEIWVAAGTYKPLYAADGKSTNPRSKAFVLVDGVKIYGGFPADANDYTHNTIEARSPNSHLSILSGDLNDDDTDDLAVNKSDNAYHVVVGANILDGETILDDFIITGGYANGGESDNITVNGKTVYSYYGGGILNTYSSPTLTNLTVSGNAAVSGGGIFNDYSSPTFTNLIISGNAAFNGGGGGICNGNSYPRLTNLTISGNTATVSGGGMSNYSSSSPTLTNSIVWGNSAPTGSNVDNYGTTTTYYYSLVQDEDLRGTGTGNFNGKSEVNNPRFISTTIGNYRLQTSSPAIDAGNNNSNSLDRDLDGNPRLYGARIDLGAYEYQLAHDAGGIVYIKQDGTGGGSSWEGAYSELADVLLAAKTNANIKEIWVAAGTYKPLYLADDTSDNPRDKAFVLVDDLNIYGGFPANANGTDHTSVQTGRAPSLHVTILSGDLKGDDTGDLTTNKSDNAYHVVIDANNESPDKAILDGFTITGGNADGESGSNIVVNGQTVNRRDGGGIYIYSSSPTLANLTISGNSAINDGGGIYNNYSSTTLTNIIISGNKASMGGGIYSYYYSSPTLTNITISGNSASSSGGGIYNYYYSSLTLTNITISGNSAGSYGGGILINSSSPTLTNITISGNTANNGGGIYNNASSPTLNNTIVWGNSASTGNNLLNTNSTPTYNYSLVQGVNLTGTGNLNGELAENNPRFVSPAVAPTPTTTGNYRLLSASPLIDKGNNDLYATATVLDLDGNPRFSGASIDLGAYEFSELIWTGLAGNSWAEPANWKFGEVPNKASSVYIPANLGAYPVLTAADVAAVKNIRFAPGAEIGRQDLLSYEKAYVQLDFSAPASRNRWYMLSNPLQQLYAGDFSFGGYPGMDMKLFQIDPEQDNRTVWKRITGLNQSFSAGNGFIVWLAPNRAGDTKGLALSDNIIELPYFDNINVPADVHWTHTYNDVDTKSTFKAWKEENGSIVENNDITETVVLRNNEAYRLAGQTVSEPINFGESHFAIAGNPYMSSIDFEVLYDANNSLIGSNYQIWIGPGGISGGSYTGYNALVSHSFGTLYSVGPEGSSYDPGSDELDKNIAPMQSFIVEKSSTNTFTGEQAFSFDLSAVGVTGVKTKLRSEAPQGDKLDIVASTAQAGVRTLIASHQAGGDSFGSAADSRKLFGEINNIPEIYTLKPGARNEQVATAVNVLGEITDETLVPLAISTTYSGELTFTFSGMDTYNARISLLDTETNTETELTDKAQYEYRFDYVPEQSGGKTVANENRFFIRLNKSFTDIEEIASEAIRIYAPLPGTLQVVSTQPLRHVTVYNLQGSVIYNTSAIQANTQKVEGIAAGVYIVKAVSGNTVTTEKVVVR